MEGISFPRDTDPVGYWTWVGFALLFGGIGQILGVKIYLNIRKKLKDSPHNISNV